MLFSHWVVSNSLQSHEHILPGFPVLHSLPVCSNICSVSLRCHRTISFTTARFSSCLQSSPASGSFSISWLFPLGGQSIGASASPSVLLMNIQSWFPLGLVGLISLLSKSLPQHHNSKALIFWHSVFFMVQLSHLYMITGKTIALAIWTFANKVISLLFNMLSRFVIVFLLLISWLHSPFAVILELKKICHFFTFYFSWSNGTRWCDLSFLECWVLSQVFHSPLSPSPRDFSVPFYFLP